jgi:putative transposase
MFGLFRRKEDKIIYKTIIVPLKCNKTDFEYLRQLNKISAQVWNNCVNIDKEHIKVNKKSMTLSELEFENKKNFPLHAKGINHVVLKYYNCRNAMWKSIQKKHDGSRLAKLPYKEKAYIPTGWDSQSINAQKSKNIIKLAGIKNRGQAICHVKSIPENIVEVELIYKDKYYLAIKYKENNNTNLIQSDNSASIDLGEIHGITSIDNNGNCVILTNRKLRSLIREKDKRQGELKSLRSNCKQGSLMATKYTKAIYKISFEYENKILDIIHKQTKLYLDWCIEHNISKVYYGDVDSTTRNSKGKLSQHTNHKLNMWQFGLLIIQLENKLSRHGIKLEKVDEAYTSQTCPNCGKRNKPTDRNYHCKKCNYEQHRDIVGAINILNFNTDNQLKRYTNKVYLQIT